MRVALLIVYDLGSAAPTRLGEAACMEDCELVFLTTNSPHSRMMRPVLEMLGTVLEMGEDDSEDDILRSLRKHDLAGITTFAESLIPRTARLARRLGLPQGCPTQALGRCRIDKYPLRDGNGLRAGGARNP
jgi:hypothetical protein